MINNSDPVSIPDAAREAAHQTGAIGYSDVLLASAHLVVAAELRDLLRTMEDYEKLGEVFRLIESRIAELDPEGLTS